MENNLTVAQQVFAVFYAIFFGLMLQTIGAHRANSNSNKKIKEKKPEVTLNLFDTPNIWEIGFKWRNKPGRRFILSILFLNILPAVVFAFIFRGLGYLKVDLDVIRIVFIVWISLIPHYIYRVYLGVLLLFKDELFLSEKDSKKYSAADIDARGILISDRYFRDDAHKSPTNHFAIPIFLYFP